MGTEAPKLIFQEPPTLTRGRGSDSAQSPIGLWLAALREHPGQWAAFPEPLLSRPNTRAMADGGKYGVEKAGQYEATTRAASNKRHQLFARYLGPS